MSPSWLPFMTLLSSDTPPHTRSDCQTAPVMQLLWPFVAPAFIWWTTVGKCNLPLHQYPLQLPANIIKEGGSGPCARCHPPVTLCLSSAATRQNSSHKWFIPFQADFCITLTLVRQTDRRAWEIHRDGSRGTDLHRLKWHTQNGVTAAFTVMWDNWGALQAKNRIRFKRSD